MKLCKTCPEGKYVTEITVDVCRTNLCQWVWGFAGAFWRGEKTLKLRLHTGQPSRVFHNGQLVYSSETQPGDPNGV